MLVVPLLESGAGAVSGPPGLFGVLGVGLGWLRATRAHLKFLIIEQEAGHTLGVPWPDDQERRNAHGCKSRACAVQDQMLHAACNTLFRVTSWDDRPFSEVVGASEWVAAGAAAMVC